MEFHYYYLIQDFMGIILAFIGIRMFMLYLRIASVKKLSKNAILFLVKYALAILSGSNLLMHQFGFKPWILSGVLIIISVIISPRVNTVSMPSYTPEEPDVSDAI
jgi:hypothetical protein